MNPTEQRQREIAAELTLRAQSLPEEMRHWQKLASANTQGFGIHKSQIAAVGLLLEAATARQADALANLSPDTAPDAFAEQRQRVEQQITSAHLLLNVFRYVLQQRTGKKPVVASTTPSTPTLLDPLDLADLVAARAYRHCLDVAQTARVITAEQFREPPLCYFNAQRSPTAFTRRHTVGSFVEFRFSEEVAAKLPVSLLSLPVHFARAVWTFNTLFHEIGHLVDQDLGLQAALHEPVQAVVSPDTAATWRSWLREIIADGFGVLLGGAAFAHTLAKLLYLPTSEMTHRNPNDVHPTPAVRLHLVAAFLETMGETTAAQTLANETTTRCGTPETWPAPLPMLVAETSIVARAVLQTSLLAVGNKMLCDFAAPAEWKTNARELAVFLVEGKMPPDTAQFPMAVVPIAAQNAVAALPDDPAHDEASKRFAQIHERALRFAERIPRPSFLAAPFYVAGGGGSDARTAHLQTRANDALNLLETELSDETF